MTSLTLDDFRRLTEHMPGNTPIIVPTNYCYEFYHDEYRHATAVIDTAMFGHKIIEDLGEGSTSADYGQRRKVVIVR